MATILNRTTTFATNGTVTAAGLHNLIDDTAIYSGLITTQTNLATVGTGDKLLIAQASGGDTTSPFSTTVLNLFDDALTNGTYTDGHISNNLTYGTATGNRTVSTSATITTGTIPNLTSSTANITLGTIPTLTAGTTTSTAANITNGTVQTLTASTANITTGTITNLSATTSTFLGAITGSTNVIDIGSGQIYKDATGNVGIGITPTTKLNVYDAVASTVLIQGDSVAQAIVNRASADVSAARVTFRKSRGSIASPAAVATSDSIGDMFFQAFGGTTNRNVAVIRSSVESYVSDSDISSNLTFLTSPAGGITATEKLRIAPAGQIGIGGANYGTSGQVLTSAGASAAPSWQTASGITSGTAVASTSGTAIDFTGIPSTAKIITVMFDVVSTNGNSDLLIQLGISSGFVATGYAGSGGNVYSLNGCGAAGSTSGFVIVAGGPSTIRNGSMVITNISGNTWISSHAMGTSDNGGGQAGGGSKSLSATLDRIRITTVNGTDAFDAGSINIIYEG